MFLKKNWERQWPKANTKAYPRKDFAFWPFKESGTQYPDYVLSGTTESAIPRTISLKKLSFETILQKLSKRAGQKTKNNWF